MLGCMVESAILATAAAHLSPLVDWADLDGPFLTRDDPFLGITYERGKIVLPRGPGLGVVERSRSARDSAALCDPRTGHVRDGRAKTAHGVIAYADDETVAVIDRDHAGKSVRDVVPYLDLRRADRGKRCARRCGTRRPRCSSASRRRAARCPKRGATKSSRRSTPKLEVVSGLHEILGDDPEFARRSATRRRIDLGRPHAAAGTALFGRASTTSRRASSSRSEATARSGR